MKYRPLNLDEDYVALKLIWAESKMKVAPAKEMLSPYGVAVEHDGNVVGALFNFYIAGTQMVLIGYPILDIFQEVDRDEIVDQMFHHAEFLAAANGYKYAQTYSSLSHIDDRLERNGWIVGDPHATNYFKKL